METQKTASHAHMQYGDVLSVDRIFNVFTSYFSLFLFLFLHCSLKADYVPPEPKVTSVKIEPFFELLFANTASLLKTN